MARYLQKVGWLFSSLGVALLACSLILAPGQGAWADDGPPIGGSCKANDGCNNGNCKIDKNQNCLNIEGGDKGACQWSVEGCNNCLCIGCYRSNLTICACQCRDAKGACKMDDTCINQK